jgi:sterol desaturase/sphingolipid hydroxylase (fatty acid hydroxylase superfamily)
MDGIERLLGHVLKPALTPLFPQQRIFVGYLLVAFVIAAVIVIRQSRNRSWRAAVARLFDRAVWFNPSALVDYGFFLVNRVSFGILFGPLVIGAVAVASMTEAGLKSAYGELGPGFAVDPLAVGSFTLATLIAMDGAIFLAHFLQHRIPILWEFHKVHHSATVLTPITLYRMHPVDDLLSGTIVGIATGAVAGVAHYMFAGPLVTVTIVGLNVGLFLFYLAGYNLRHSHVWLAYPRWLSHVLISPAQHQIHHSRRPCHHDRNLGLVFAFWDYFAGTLYVPRRRERLAFGLGGGEDADYGTVLALYWVPFKKAARLLRPRRWARP